jgi:hypothetical protein
LSDEEYALKPLIGVVALLLIVPAAYAQEDTISPALNEQLDALVSITEQLRGLETIEPVVRQFPTRQETIDYLAEIYNRDLPAEELERSRLLYVSLDMLPPDVDLGEVYLNLLGSQIAGFYDTDTQTMNVIPTIGDDVGESLSLTEQIVFIHEYTHALQDQHFSLDMLEDEALQSAPDQLIAVLALIEGDATAVMQVYSQEVALRNPGAAFELLAEGLMAGNLTLPEGVPPVLARELLFPYEAGLSFVLALYNDGGWERINAAYENLPQTSEQIIHPEKYLAGEEAVPVEALDLGLSDEWQEVWNITLGEFYLREHLRTQLSSFEAGQGAAGWGGDHFQLYVDPETNDLIWTLQIVWDTPEDMVEFTDLYIALGDLKFGNPPEEGCWSNNSAALCLINDSNGSLIISAPSLEMAQDIFAVQQG